MLCDAVVAIAPDARVEKYVNTGQIESELRRRAGRRYEIVHRECVIKWRLVSPQTYRVSPYLCSSLAAFCIEPFTCAPFYRLGVADNPGW